MASKRMHNHLYWLTVKAVALHGNSTEGNWPGHELVIVQYYRRALAGAPDRELKGRILETYEEKLGPHRKADLRNKELWVARRIVDGIRDAARSRT